MSEEGPRKLTREQTSSGFLPPSLSAPSRSCRAGARSRERRHRLQGDHPPGGAALSARHAQGSPGGSALDRAAIGGKEGQGRGPSPPGGKEGAAPTPKPFFKKNGGPSPENPRFSRGARGPPFCDPPP